MKCFVGRAYCFVNLISRIVHFYLLKLSKGKQEKATTHGPQNAGVNVQNLNLSDYPVGYLRVTAWVY